MVLTMIAPCLFGLEAPLAYEAKTLGLQEVRAENGRVCFCGEPADLVRANLHLRYAERVLLCLGEFEARSFEELFEGVRRLDWQDWIGKKDAFPVKGHAISSQLHSVPDCQAIIKKAVVEKLKTVYHLPWFEETGPRHQIQFSILKDRVTVALDTTGAGLHKRGYRAVSTLAPIKETLAAGLLDIARYKPDKPLFDPMCGSGTFLIEAAMQAKGIAPGLRRRFAAQEWEQIPAALWTRQREEAMAKVRSGDAAPIEGWDIDPSAVELARANAKKAGVDDLIHVSVRDIAAFSSMEARGMAVTNPPYGERLLDRDAARALYRTMGKVFTKKDGWSYFIISPDEAFEHYFGRPADKKRKLYNGMLKCEFFQYFRR